MQKRWPRIGVAAFVALCGTFIGGAGCGTKLPPDGADVTKSLSALILNPGASCEQLRAVFRVEYLPIVQNPGEAGFAYEEHWLPKPNGELIHAWYLPTRLDRGTVVVSMGAVGRMACYLFVAKLLTENGWSVALFEYQGFGDSSGEASLGTIVSDLETAVDFALQRSGRERVTLLGISLGTIPSVAVAARRPGLVNGLVLDSPVAIGEELKRFSFLLGGQPGLYAGNLPPELLAEQMIAGVHAPLLIFQHGLDSITPPEMVELLYDRAAGPKLLARFPNLGHARGPFFQTSEYLFYLESFLSDVWRWPTGE